MQITQDVASIMSSTTTTTTTTVQNTINVDNIPILPEGIILSYLAEGAANVVFRLRFRRQCSDDNDDRKDNHDGTTTFDATLTSTHLLRLRKTLASVQPNLDSYRYLSTKVFKLFPAHFLVPTKLIKLPTSLLRRENERLKQLDVSGLRPGKRRGMYLDETEPFGFLVGDMSPQHYSRQILFEFKPKWLVQSPSAPVDSVRCRTCALRLHKAALGTAKPDGFCPLDFASGDPARVRRAVKFFLPSHHPMGFLVSEKRRWKDEVKVLENLVVDYLVKSELMPHLKTLQARLDPDGPLKSAMGQSFLDAMTVRDLTVFLRVDMHSHSVEARIGDLDMKSKNGGKAVYWRDTEAALVDGGWYQGTEVYGEQEWKSWKCQFT